MHTWMTHDDSTIAPGGVAADLKKHILVDGFGLVVDVTRSRGNRFYDAGAGRTLIDLYSFYASMPIGFNHPYFDRPDVREDLLEAALVKVANSDVYTTQYARFVRAFERVAGLAGLDRYFFIEGGALAVENALKAAMDWKVRKNLAAGRGELGTEVLHFTNAFHGRSGYTLSLTNTDPTKTKYFAKFDWPRVTSPSLDFSLPPSERERQAAADERAAEAEILAALAARPHRICAIIIEPIQCEGGDCHFRGPWLHALRRICDERDLLLIFDEVQTGMGMTGRMWCCQHFGVVPDILVFGKKSQACGIMAGRRLDDVPENVFRQSSRINSTWGGNLTDMVRATHYLKIIEEERLVENAGRMGEEFLARLHALAGQTPMMTAARGCGLILAFTLPDAATRNAFWKGCFELGLLTLRCGERSIRLRPTLDVTRDVIDEAVVVMKDQFRRMAS